MELNGAAAVVSGGAGGLGEATVRRLVDAGARVVIADLADDKGAALAASLGDGVAFRHCDVTSEASVRDAFAAAADLGPVRLAVSVHGGFGGGGRTLGKDGTPRHPCNPVQDYEVNRRPAVGVGQIKDIP